MSTSDDDWLEFAKRSTACAVCCQGVAAQDRSGRDNFINCPNCGTLLVFDGFGRLLYSAPESLDAFLVKNRVFTSVPARILEMVPETVVRENYAGPIAERNGFLIMGMVHPILDVVDKLRFILYRNVLAVRISEDIFQSLIRHYPDIDGDVS